MGFLFYGVGAALVTSVTGAPDFLSTISAHQTTLVIGAFLMLLNTVVDVGKGVLFFPILEKHGKRSALAYLAFIIVQVVMLDVGVLALLLIVPLGQQAIDVGQASAAWAQGLGSLSSVTTSTWAIVHYLGVAMCLLILLGITGIYARQVEESGWLGLAGFLLFSLMWALTTALQFAEAFILPVLATDAPKFVEGFLGIPAGTASEVSLGILPAVYSLTSVLYLLGGVLFGIATFRARILPRWAGGGLAVGTVAPLALSLLLPTTSYGWRPCRWG